MSNYDSDEDYQDVGQTDPSTDLPNDSSTAQTQTNLDGKRVRGKDIE